MLLGSAQSLKQVFPFSFFHGTASNIDSATAAHSSPWSSISASYLYLLECWGKRTQNSNPSDCYHQLCEWTSPLVCQTTPSPFFTRLGIFEGAPSNSSRIPVNVLDGRLWRLALAFNLCGFFNDLCIQSLHIASSFSTIFLCNYNRSLQRHSQKCILAMKHESNDVLDLVQPVQRQ